MDGYNVIKKDNKFYVSNEFWGDMMIYSVKKNPYIKRLGTKFYLTDLMKKQLNEMMIEKN